MYKREREHTQGGGLLAAQGANPHPEEAEEEAGYLISICDLSLF